MAQEQDTQDKQDTQDTPTRQQRWRAAVARSQTAATALGEALTALREVQEEIDDDLGELENDETKRYAALQAVCGDEIDIQNAIESSLDEIQELLATCQGVKVPE